MPSDSDRISLDLISGRLLVDRLRRPLFWGVVFAGIVGALLAKIISTTVGLTVVILLLLPLVIVVSLTLRHRIWLDHRVIHRKLWRVQRVNITAASSVQLRVRSGRINHVMLRVGDDQGSVSVSVALYSKQGGRELSAFALRQLADALLINETTQAQRVAEVFIAQLKAEAREALLEARPLYRAGLANIEATRSISGSVRFFREKSLSEAELAELSN